MNIPRSDELATESQIERSKKSDNNLKKGIKTAIGVGATVAGGGLSSRILPFLSEHIPVDLAIKGISKISPKWGDFLKKGMSQGLNVKDGINYIKENFKPEGKQEALGKFKEHQKRQGLQEELTDQFESHYGKQQPNQRNIIQQYSDELHEFLDDLIKKGRQPLEAGALAQLNPKFKSAISKLEKDHKAPFSSILQAIYGGGQEAQQPQQDQSKAALQGQQQPGQGQQALMGILQKINQMRGGS